MPQILLFSDIHIHPHKNSQKRLQHCLDALKWVFDVAVERHIEDVIFLGDLFQDREKIQVLPYQRTFEIIQEYTKKLNLYLLIGNHDMWFADKTDISSIYPLGALENVTVISKPTPLKISGCDFDFLPFTLNPLDDIKMFREPNRVLCGHLALDGAALNLVYNTRADVSVEHEADMVKVDANLFSGWKKVFLGHYHGAQKIGEGIEYVGSPLQLNFSEAMQKKHIVIFDAETLETEYVDNTFSPRHLVIKRSQLDDYDLSNTYLKVEPEDIAEDDLVELKQTLLESHDILTLEFLPAKKEQESQQIEDAKSIMTNDRLELLKRYVNAVETELEKEKLIEIGEYIWNKSQFS